MSSDKLLYQSVLGRYRNKRTVSCFAENHHTVDQCEKGMVFADTYIFTGMMNGSSLTNKNVACFGELSAKNFYT